MSDIGDLLRVSATSNLVGDDPSFESGTNGFLARSGYSTASVDGARAHTGTKSLKLTLGNAGGYFLAQRANIEGLYPDTVYQASAWYYVPASDTPWGLQHSAYYTIHIGGASVINTHSTQAGIGEGWVRVQVSFETNSNVTPSVYFYLYGSGSAGESVWVDDVQLLVTPPLIGDVLSVGASVPGPLGDLLGVTASTPVQPTCSAGDTQIGLEPYDTISLIGSSTDSPDSWSWRQISGPSVALEGASTASASYTAPGTLAGATLKFELTVTKGGITSARSAVEHIVLYATEAIYWNGRLRPAQVLICVSV